MQPRILHFDTVRAANNGGISEAILWTPVRDGKLSTSDWLVFPSIRPSDMRLRVRTGLQSLGWIQKTSNKTRRGWEQQFSI